MSQGGMNEHQRRLAWGMRLGIRGFIGLGLLVVTLIFLVRHQVGIALLSAAFLAFNVALVVIVLRRRP